MILSIVAYMLTQGLNSVATRRNICAAADYQIQIVLVVAFDIASTHVVSFFFGGQNAIKGRSLCPLFELLDSETRLGWINVLLVLGGRRRGANARRLGSRAWKPSSLRPNKPMHVLVLVCICVTVIEDISSHDSISQSDAPFSLIILLLLFQRAVLVVRRRNSRLFLFYKLL